MLPADIAAELRRTMTLMSIWDELLPGKVLHMPYEKLVSSQEAASRELLQHCGLPWDEAVLSFHTTTRVVQTASLAQVQTCWVPSQANP